MDRGCICNIHLLCNIALFTCCCKASLVGGIVSIERPFCVNKFLRHSFTPLAELVRSYRRTTKRSIMIMSSFVKQFAEGNLKENYVRTKLAVLTF